MTERATNGRVTFQYWDFVLTNAAVAKKNGLACLDTSSGEVVPGGTSTTLLPIGTFTEALTGDGVLTANVRLFAEVFAEYWDNDTNPNNVTAADIGSEVYIKDDHTVSTSSATSTRSIAGRVWDVDAHRGVLVQAGTAVTGPTGASGAGLVNSVATRAALTALDVTTVAEGATVLVRSDRSLWTYVGASTLASDEALELVLDADVGAGSWFRCDKAFTMKVPIAAALADNATILTVPEGFVLRLTGLPYWECTTTFSGGTNSKIGISSSKTGYTGDGAILGAAAGDTLAAGIKAGTIGDKMDTEAEMQAFIMVEGDTLVYNEIVDAFTLGAGFVCVPVSVNSTAPATP